MSLLASSAKKFKQADLCFFRFSHRGAPSGRGAAIALIFFGFEGFLREWLVFKSGFLPRFLGVSMVGGLGWLTFLWPPLGSQVFIPVALFAVVRVFATAGWLFIRGVDDAKWRERTALAATSIWR